MTAGRGLRGFSLVEMVAALTIFSAGVVGVLGVFTACLRSTAASADQTRAAFLAQGLAEDVLATDEFVAGQESGDGGDAFPKATWTREVAETDVSGLYEVLVTVTWPERGGETTFRLTTLVAER